MMTLPLRTLEPWEAINVCSGPGLKYSNPFRLTRIGNRFLFLLFISFDNL